MSIFLDKDPDSLIRKKKTFLKRLKQSRESLKLPLTSEEKEEIERVIALYRRKITEIEEKLLELED